MKMNPMLLDEVNYVWKASGKVVQVYDTNGWGAKIPVAFTIDPRDPTVFHLSYTPFGEITCDVN